VIDAIDDVDTVRPTQSSVPVPGPGLPHADAPLPVLCGRNSSFVGFSVSCLLSDFTHACSLTALPCSLLCVVALALAGVVRFRESAVVGVAGM